MHSNLSVTDGVYGILSENDVRGQIAALGRQIISIDSERTKELMPLLEQLIDQLRDGLMNEVKGE